MAGQAGQRDDGAAQRAPEVPPVTVEPVDFDVVIGLEVHCQLQTQSKLFCGCTTRFGQLANHQVCPVCLGLPGVLPVLNETAVDFAVRLALAVGAEVAESSVFARKQYFYPDLPKGYQITQYDQPYCRGGQVTLASGRAVPLTRIHLEEDAGKSVHGDGGSYVDCNRAGMPLVEIVSEPALSSPAEAADYLRRLRALVRYLGVSDGNLEEGSFRCDANVSLKPVGQAKLGTRCEIKNLNSFKNVERAIAYEIERQGDILRSGGVVSQQTRLFDADQGHTAPMRSKEDSHDYRYLPDPDLPILRLSAAYIEARRAALPELPDALARRFAAEYELGTEAAAMLSSEREVAAYFTAACASAGSQVAPRLVGNFLVNELLPTAREANWDWAAPPVTSARVGELLALTAAGTISSKIARGVFDHMVQGGRDGPAPAALVASLGLVQVSDTGAIEALIEQVITASPAQLAQYLSGKEKILGYFVGQIMKESQGKMNPGLVNKLLLERLAARRGG